MAKGLLKNTYIPTLQERYHRQVIRRRRQLIRDQIKAQNGSSESAVSNHLITVGNKDSDQEDQVFYLYIYQVIVILVTYPCLSIT